MYHLFYSMFLYDLHAIMALCFFFYYLTAHKVEIRFDFFDEKCFFSISWILDWFIVSTHHIRLLKGKPFFSEVRKNSRFQDEGYFFISKERTQILWTLLRLQDGDKTSFT
jgi:hypothetical protein